MCDYFVRLLQLLEPPLTMRVLWSSWRALVRPLGRDIGDLVVKSLVWNIWLAKNDCIFNTNVLPAYVVILKIDRIFCHGSKLLQITLDSSWKTPSLPYGVALSFWDHG